MTDVLYTPACATSALAAALWLMLERLRMPFWFTVALAPSADWSINETLLRYSVPPLPSGGGGGRSRSEEHTSELQSLMRTSYAVFCLKKKIRRQHHDTRTDVQHHTQLYL